jgi:hypothetical protein
MAGYHGFAHIDLTSLAEERMGFLCAHHRHSIEEQDEQTLIKTWFQWMEQAESHYFHRDWQQALPLMGGAFDLATILIKRLDDETMVNTMLCLSAIFSSNVLHHMQREEEADRVILYTQALLAEQPVPEVKELTHVVADEDCHGTFVQHHLNVSLHQRHYQSPVLH